RIAREELATEVDHHGRGGIGTRFDHLDEAGGLLTVLRLLQPCALGADAKTAANDEVLSVRHALVFPGAELEHIAWPKQLAIHIVAMRHNFSDGKVDVRRLARAAHRSEGFPRYTLRA